VLLTRDPVFGNAADPGPVVTTNGDPVVITLWSSPCGHHPVVITLWSSPCGHHPVVITLW
jgi:hypothetical protein